jgi:hypothetical protein
MVPRGGLPRVIEFNDLRKSGALEFPEVFYGFRVSCPTRSIPCLGIKPWTASNFLRANYPGQVMSADRFCMRRE